MQFEDNNLEKDSKDMKYEFDNIESDNDEKENKKKDNAEKNSEKIEENFLMDEEIDDSKNNVKDDKKDILKEEKNDNFEVLHNKEKLNNYGNEEEIPYEDDNAQGEEQHHEPEKEVINEKANDPKNQNKKSIITKEKKVNVDIDNDTFLTGTNLIEQKEKPNENKNNDLEQIKEENNQNKKKTENDKHRGMHNLSGVYIKKGEDLEFEGKKYMSITILYS